MKKALIVATVYNFISSFEKENISILQNMGYEVWCACNMDEADGRLDKMGLHIVPLPVSRSPFSPNNIKAYQKLVELVRQEKFDVLHCHTPVGGVLARMAAKRYCIPKVIYTAHGFHFYKGAPKLNWLLYYPVEKWLAKETDILITINKEDYERAKLKFRAKSIKYVPGVGVDLENIKKAVITIDKAQKRIELGIPENAKMLLSVGELSDRKNHQLVLKALSQLKDVNIYYIICGKGLLERQLIQLSRQLRCETNFILLGQREDVFEIMAIADIFVFPSKQEGLPVALMEAMAVGLPCVVSNIRGNNELIVNNVNGYLFSIGNAEELCQGISETLNSNREKIKLENSFKLLDYSKKRVAEEMTELYNER